MNLKKLFTVIMVLCLSFSVQAAANKKRPVPKPKSVPVTYSMATSFAYVVNKLGTVGEYTKWIGRRINPDELKAMTESYAKMGISMDTKLPKMTAKKDKVFFGKNNFILVKEKSLTYKGIAFAPSDKPHQQLVMDIYNAINGKKTAANVFFPEANAYGATDTAFDVGGILLGGGTGYFLGPKLGINETVSTIGGSVLGYFVAQKLKDDAKQQTAMNLDIDLGIDFGGGNNGGGYNEMPEGLFCYNKRPVICSAYEDDGLNLSFDLGGLNINLGNKKPQQQQPNCRQISAQEFYTATGAFYDPKMCPKGGTYLSKPIMDFNNQYFPHVEDRFPRPDRPAGAVDLPGQVVF